MKTIEDIAQQSASTIAGAWTTFANINWFKSKSRDDVERIKASGAEALSRLVPVAMSDTNQSKHIAGFLLSLYNGKRFHFDMSALQNVDHELVVDCITALMMNSLPGSEIHTYVELGDVTFEKLAKDWGFKDYSVVS